MLGDTTAQDAGRLTLNPIRHLDPFGTLLLVLTTFTGAAGFGWGKPVPVDGRALKWGRTGMAIVSGAGPLSNVIFAFVCAFGLRYSVDLGLGTTDGAASVGIDLLFRLIALNVGLCVFNLLPIAPLDGFGVLFGVLPATLAYRLGWLGKYGPPILLVLVFSGSIIGFSLLSLILGPPTRELMRLVLGAAGLR